MADVTSYAELIARRALREAGGDAVQATMIARKYARRDPFNAAVLAIMSIDFIIQRFGGNGSAREEEAAHEAGH
jgi:hypothetical protein